MDMVGHSRGRQRRPGHVRDTVSGVFWDITGNKRVQLALQSENDNKDCFIAKLSHEMRTPLSTILGYCELAEKRTTDGNLRQNLAAIHNNGVFLSRLIEDMLDLSRIVADTIRLEKNPWISML